MNGLPTEAVKNETDVDENPFCPSSIVINSSLKEEKIETRRNHEGNHGLLHLKHHGCMYVRTRSVCLDGREGGRRKLPERKKGK